MPRSKTRKPDVLLLFGWHDPEGFEAVSEYAVEHGWHLELRAYFADSVPEHWDGDGILYSKGVREKIDRFVVAQSARCPVVSLNANQPKGLEVPVVSPDDAAAGRMAAEHLIARGHRELVFYRPIHGPVADERWRGFEERGRQAGCTLHSIDVRSRSSSLVPWSKQRARLAAQLHKLPAQVGVLALDDLVAAELIEVALESGLRVPADLAVVGLGNLRPVCEAAQLPITSIDLRAGEVARQGAELLDRLMRGKAAPKGPVRVAPGALVARESSDVTVVHDPRLARAVAFLREKIRGTISLDQIAAAGGVSRRTLYHLFRDELSTTPADYLRHERTLIAERLMREQPGMTRQQAAREAGFSCTRTLTRSLQDSSSCSSSCSSSSSRTPNHAAVSEPLEPV